MEALPDHQQSQRIRVVHLADHSGRLQVLFPESNMLDIAAVSRITKRRLEPVAHFHPSGDALIKPNSVMTIIESSLLENDQAFLIRTKAGGQYREITGRNIRDSAFARFFP